MELIHDIPVELKEPEPFLIADHLSDVALVVEDQQIHFNKAFLSACSPVFDRMFHGDFAEKSSKEIPLPGKRYEDMITFLQLIHPAHAHSTHVADANLMSLLDLCREYQVESVRNKCEQYIDVEVQLHPVKKLTADRLLLFLYARDQYKLNIKQLKTLKALAQAEKSSVYKASSNFKKFSCTPSFLEILNGRCESMETILVDTKNALEKYDTYLPKQSSGDLCKCTYTTNSYGVRICHRLCDRCGLVKMRSELEPQIKKMKTLNI